MKTALVTGAGGFIGSHCVDFLLEKGWKVFATVRPNKKTRNLNHLLDGSNPNFNFRELDIRDAAWVESIVKEVRPDGVFHFAAQSLVQPSWEDPADTITTNMNGTINLFEAIKKYEIKARVVIACSSAAYGTSFPEELPLKETNPIRALHPYGISKIGQELLGRQYFINFGIESILLRLFNQTGPRKVFDASSDFAKRLGMIECERSEPVLNVGNLDTSRDITGIKDTLAALWVAFEKGEPGETYNLCSNKATKIRDVLDYLLSLCSKEVKVIENTPDKLRISDEVIILGDNTKLKALGFKPSQEINDVLKNMFDDWVEYFKVHEDYVHTQ